MFGRVYHRSFSLCLSVFVVDDDSMNVALTVLLALMAPQSVRITDAPENFRVETPPEIAAYTDPFYTRIARDNKIEGTVTVEAAIDSKGSVTILRTVKGLGY